VDGRTYVRTEEHLRRTLLGRITGVDLITHIHVHWAYFGFGRVASTQNITFESWFLTD